MLYSFAKILMTAGLRFFYRHVYVTGLENIPSTGPVIIIANHNSSLMDAALLGVLLKRRAYFFARGDVFVNKFVQRILWWLHMMPVHGHQGGRNTLGANRDSFFSGQQILLHGGVIVFFPESFSHIERQLLPFRKGVFRLAFDAATAGNFSFDIPIVPIGITYDHPVNGRTGVQVHAGKPLLLSAYLPEYKLNSAAALLHLCKDAHQAMSPLVLHIADKGRLETAEQLMVMNRNDNLEQASSWKIASARQLDREQDICRTVNNMDALDFQQQKQTVAGYTDLLSGKNLADKTTTHRFSFPGWKKIFLWIGFPFYLIGLLLNGLPILLARQITDKKVYRKDFYSWIFVACYSFMYFFWMLILLTACFLCGWIYAAGLLVIMISTGLFAYRYKDWIKDNRQQRIWNALVPEKKSELLKLRQACVWMR